jgi:uncharacterized SAM-binding protein YcdF (DUF218 family)
MASPSRVVWSVLLGTALLAVLVWLVSLASVIIWSRRDTVRTASAIVVLGAAQYVGRPSPVLRARLDHAIRLHRRGVAPYIVFTGGIGTGDTTSEAEVSRAYALRRGVPDSAILVETEGRDTRESLESVAGIMRRRRLSTAVLVSDPFHMARLRILATQLGIVPYTSPTRTSPISANREQSWRYVLSESLKLPIALLMRPRGSAEAPTGRLAPDRDSLRAARDSARRDSLRADSAATDSAARDSMGRDSSGAGRSRSKPLVRPTKPPPKKA